MTWCEPPLLWDHGAVSWVALAIAALPPSRGDGPVSDSPGSPPAAAKQQSWGSHRSDGAQPIGGGEPAVQLPRVPSWSGSEHWTEPFPPTHGLGAGNRPILRSNTEPLAVGPGGLPFFSRQLFQSVNVHSLLGHDPFQPGILRPQFLQPLQGALVHASILATPPVDGSFRDTRLAAKGSHGLAYFHFPLDPDDLFLGVTLALHEGILPCWLYYRTLSLQVVQFSGGRSPCLLTRY
jgi:hypothetical protein